MICSGAVFCKVFAVINLVHQDIEMLYSIPESHLSKSVVPHTLPIPGHCLPDAMRKRSDNPHGRSCTGLHERWQTSEALLLFPLDNTYYRSHPALLSDAQPGDTAAAATALSPGVPFWQRSPPLPRDDRSLHSSQQGIPTPHIRQYAVRPLFVKSETAHPTPPDVQ